MPQAIHLANDATAQYSRMPQDGLYVALRAKTHESPRLAWGLAALLTDVEERQSIRKEAFLAGAGLDTVWARSLLDAGEAEEWIGDVNFSDALRLGAERVIAASARKFPAVAVRSVADYFHLPFGPGIFRIAAIEAPEEAVAVATAKPVLRPLLSPALAAIAASTSVEPLWRERVAMLSAGTWSLPHALTIAKDDGRYFSALVDLRLAGKGSAAALDRAMEVHALRVCRDAARGGSAVIASLNKRDLYLLLAYGRAEEDDTFFTTIFDRNLSAKLRGTSLLRLIEQTKGIRYRAFVATAISFHRWNQFLDLAGAERQQILSRFVRGIDDLEEAATAAEVVESARGTAMFNQLRDMFQAEQAVATNKRAASIYGLLAARAGSGIALYRDLWRTTEGMAAPKKLVARYYFYDDEDGVESFQVFRRTYEQDTMWRIEDFDGYLRISSKLDGRIEMWANAPIDVLTAAGRGHESESDERRARITRALAERGVTPHFIVHRGHALHVEKTIAQIPRAAELVFLGSCRGLTKMQQVMEMAPQAQVFVTRGIGSHSINDPVLHALNGALLSGAVTWESFWRQMESRLGRNALFADYVPPHKNAAAQFLRAYHELSRQ